MRYFRMRESEKRNKNINPRRTKSKRGQRRRRIKAQHLANRFNQE